MYSVLINTIIKHTRGLNNKTFYAVINFVPQLPYSNSQFHPSLIFAGKDGSLSLEWSPVRGSTWVGFSLEFKDKAEVTGNVEHSSLPRYGINYNRKKLYDADPCLLHQGSILSDK